MNKLLCLLLLIASPLAAQWKYSKSVDSLIESTFRQPQGPGFSVMVIQDGAIVYEKQKGFANIRRQMPIDTLTRFATGSVTKPFTAMLIYLLEKEGKLSTTDKIHRYLPELPDFGYPIEIRHLISHTSGIKDHAEFYYLSGNGSNKNLTYTGVIQFLQKSPKLMFRPGTDFMYSNAGYELLAMIAERATHVSFGQLMKERIFIPLGMKNSSCIWSDEQALGQNTCAYSHNGRKFKKTSAGYNAMGATGIQTTLRDFYRWDQNFYTHQLTAGDTMLNFKMTKAFSLDTLGSACYGGGLLLKHYKGEKTVEHAGGWGNFLMQYRRLPRLKLSIIVCCNNQYYSPFSICDGICDLMIKELHEPELPVKRIQFPLSRFNGVYLSDYNLFRTVVAHGNSLRVYNGTDTTKTYYEVRMIESIYDSVFVFENSLNQVLIYNIKKDGDQFMWSTGHYFQVWRIYRKVAPPTNSNEQYAGAYYSADIGRKVKVKYRKRKNMLVLKPVFFVSYPLKEKARGVYSLNEAGVVVRFDESGLIFGNEWLPGMRLTRL